MSSELRDIGCNWPDCTCHVPAPVLTDNARKDYCRAYVRELIRKKLTETHGVDTHTDPRYI